MKKARQRMDKTTGRFDSVLESISVPPERAIRTGGTEKRLVLDLAAGIKRFLAESDWDNALQIRDVRDLSGADVPKRRHRRSKGDKAEKAPSETASGPPMGPGRSRSVRTPPFSDFGPSRCLRSIRRKIGELAHARVPSDSSLLGGSLAAVSGTHIPANRTGYDGLACGAHSGRGLDRGAAPGRWKARPWTVPPQAAGAW
jgi:hypothetical protein